MGSGRRNAAVQPQTTTGTSVMIVDLSAMSALMTTPRELLTTMTLFPATARAPEMTILIQAMAGDIKVDPPSRGLNLLMPLAVTGMPPSRDRPVHSIAVQQGKTATSGVHLLPLEVKVGCWTR
jgi:hypothetical protein